MAGRGIGKAESAARSSGGACAFCGRLHIHQHTAKACADKAAARAARVRKSSLT